MSLGLGPCGCLVLFSSVPAQSPAPRVDAQGRNGRCSVTQAASSRYSWAWVPRLVPATLDRQLQIHMQPTWDVKIS